MESSVPPTSLPLAASVSQSEVSPAPQVAQAAHLSAVREWWKTFDLDTRRLALDKQALEMQDAREASQLSRRKLQETTQEFKKKSAEEKTAGMKDMLKVYQTEIDSLTKRCKVSDSNFFTLYRGLYEAPDPAAALSLMLDQKSDDAQMALELQHAKRDLAQYEKEFSELKNQEVTIRRLEEVIRELEEQCEQKIQRSSELEKALEKKVKELEELCVEAKGQTERARADLFEAQAHTEERIAALTAEQELLMETNDRLQAQNTSLQRECAQFRKKLDAVLNPESQGEKPEDSARTRLVQLEEQLGDALASLARAERKLTDQARTTQRESSQMLAELMEARQALSKETDECVQLRRELESRPSRKELDAVQHQLRLLQQLDFNASGDTDGHLQQKHFPTIPDPEKGDSPEDTSGHAERTMEQIMMLRVRRLENEIRSLKRILAEAQEECNKFQLALGKSEEEVAEKKQLIAQLEDQLLQKFSTIPGSDKGTSLSDLLGTTHLEPSGLAPPNNAVAPAVVPTQHHTSSESMLKIVQAQRDRFRQRIQELESDKQQLLNELLAEKSASEQLQKDNLGMYEKIRFLQSYRTKSTRQNVNSPSVHCLEEGFKDVPLDTKYQQSYEQGLNPFHQFSQAERQRKYGELSLADKITLTTSRTLLSSKIGRSFLFFYVLALHLLVFVTLYYWAHTSTCTPNFATNQHPMQPIPANR